MASALLKLSNSAVNVGLNNQNINVIDNFNVVYKNIDFLKVLGPLLIDEPYLVVEIADAILVPPTSGTTFQGLSIKIEGFKNFQVIGADSTTFAVILGSIEASNNNTLCRTASYTNIITGLTNFPSYGSTRYIIQNPKASKDLKLSFVSASGDAVNFAYKWAVILKFSKLN